MKRKVADVLTECSSCHQGDGGPEVLGCWTAMIRGQEKRSNPHRPLTSNDMAINSSVCSHFFTFALMTTGAFSRNVGMLYTKLKLETDDPLLYPYIDLHSKIILQLWRKLSGVFSKLQDKSGSGLGMAWE